MKTLLLIFCAIFLTTGCECWSTVCFDTSIPPTRYEAADTGDIVASDGMSDAATCHCESGEVCCDSICYPVSVAPCIGGPDASDVGVPRDVTDETTEDTHGDTTVPWDIGDFDTGTNDSGQDVCHYVANYATQDIDRVFRVNRHATPRIQVFEVPEDDPNGEPTWIEVGPAGAPFLAEGREGRRWRIVVRDQNDPNDTNAGMSACTIKYLPPCTGDVTYVSWHSLVTATWFDFEYQIAGSSQWMNPSDPLCIYDADLPNGVPPEVFCPNTTTVIWMGDEETDGPERLFCVDPLHLTNQSDEGYTQCADQASGTAFDDACGFYTRSQVTVPEDQILEVEQHFEDEERRLITIRLR